MAKINAKVIVHSKCGRKHVDRGRFAEFNHRRHLCEYCGLFFTDSEEAVGVEKFRK